VRVKRLRGLGLIVMAVAAFALTERTPAQTPSATIEGRVSDTQQLVLPQTIVTLDDSQGREVQHAIADGSGHYAFNAVQPGSYTLRFSAAGFNVTTKGPIAASGRQNIIVDAILQPARVGQTVSVVAQNDRLIASKTEIPLKDLPVTVQTVPSELLLEQNATEIVSAVNNVPGANAFQLYGAYDYFIFRGFGFDNINGSAVLVNGLRLEGNRMNSQINSVESVEVLKGPASMLYGTEATGGTINILEKKPIATPAYEAVLHVGRFDTGGGEFGATGPIRGNDGLLYRADTAYMYSTGYREAGYTRFNATPAIYWRIRPGDQLNFHITSNFDRYHPDAGIPLLGTVENAANFNAYTIVPNVPLNRRYNTPGNFEKTNDAIFQVFYEHFFNNNVRIRNAWEYRYLNDQYFQSETLYVDPIAAPTTVQRSNFYFYNHDRPLLNQTDFLADFKFWVGHQFLAGYEYDQFEQGRDRSSAAQGAAEPSIDLYNPVETATPITSFPVSRFEYFKNHANAVYFQDYIRVYSKLQLLVGGRYDAFRRAASLNPVSNGVKTPGTPTNIEQNPFTYRVAANYQALPFASIYTSYGTSFTAQTSLSTDGRQLLPQTGAQFEIGDRFNFFADRLTLDTAVYHIIEKNVAVALANGVITQAGEQHSKGIEAELRGRASQRINFFANYGFTNAAYDVFSAQQNNGDIVDVHGHLPSFVPRHTARVWATYDLPRGFGFSLGGRYLSSRATDPFNYVKMGGFATFDLAARYRREKVEYALNVTNFLNKTHYFVGAIDDQATQLYPGTPIDVSGTVRYRF
jgi:iron complex outermembrane recepter protein